MRTETSIINGIKINNVVYEESDFRNSSEKQSVLNVCYSCEKFNDEKCSECSCLVENLVGLKTNSCPLGKW